MSPPRERPRTTPALRDFLRELGPRWTHDIAASARAVQDTYGALHRTVPPLPGDVVRDVPYGDDPRQRVDVFPPQPGTFSDGAAVPVLMFVHGGGFVDGQRNRTDELYANVLRWAASEGMLGLNVGYRLAPGHRFPAGAQDVCAAVDWARRHVPEWGGDPGALFLMGHSAGGAHAALAAYDRSLCQDGAGDVAGLLLLSARVRSECSPLNPNAGKVRAYYGDDPALWEQGSAVNHVSSLSTPTFIAIAEYENPLIDVHNAELYFALARARSSAGEFLRLIGHNHSSIVAHLGTDDESLAPHLLRFIRRTLASRA